jgi:hypothetical protein
MLSAVPSFGACTFPVTIGPAPATATPTPLGGFPGVRLSWPASGATNYEVQSLNGLHTTTLTTLSAGATGVTVNEVTTSNRSFSYRIIASNPSNASDVPCTGSASLSYPGQAVTLSPRVNRIVIPVVGSTRGANNAQFKTSLRLGPALSLSAGKIIFHPAGQAGSDDDPSIPYRVESGETLQFDDVVAAIGQSGIGSLDIIPTNYFPLSETELLPVEARLFNERAEGTYGAFEASVPAPDALSPLPWSAYVPSTRFRINIGVRTITPARARFTHNTPGGGQTQKVVDFPANYVVLQAADQFLGEAVNPGDTIAISFDGDNVIAIPFHTLTDNSTNDPSVFYPQSPAHIYFPVLDITIATP